MFPIQNRRSSDQVFLLTGDSPTIEQLVANARDASWEEPPRLEANTVTSGEHGFRTRVEEGRPRVQIGHELYSADKEVTDYRLHIVDMPSTRDPENSPPDVLGKLVAGIEYLRNLSPMVYDLRSLRRLIQMETRTNWRLGLKQKDTTHSNGEESKESSSHVKESSGLKLSTINLPVLEELVRLGSVTTSRLLCEWPTIVVSVSSGHNELGNSNGDEFYEEGPSVSSRILPLNAMEDVLFLSKKFRTELDDLLRDNHHENHHDFSMFSALYVWQLISQHTEWAPFYLRGDNEDNDEDAIAIGKEILNNAFCAYQLTRFICISVKCGFDSVIDSSIEHPISYYEMLIGMVRKFDSSRLTICKQMGARLSYSTIKYAALLMFGLSYNTQHKIHNIDLIRLTQYERLKCDVGDCYPLEHNLLPIQKLSDYVKNVVDQTPILVDDIPHSELGTAFEKLRSLAVSASGGCTGGPNDIWFAYNTNLFYLNAIVQQTMKGELSRKNLSLVWRVPGCQDPTTHWIAMFSSGFAFPVDLPANTLDHLNENGDLTCNLQDIAHSPRETFVVHCTQQELNWESNQRLKELFRMKNGWTKLELYAWLSRCMLSSNSPSIDELISRYLRAVPGTPNAHENLMLHVEKFDPL